MEISGFETLTDEEIIRRVRGGEKEGTDYLLEKYKNLVRKKARALYLIGGDNDDLIQEGMIGLYKAIRDYDVEKETIFRSFASVCIDRQLYNAVKGQIALKIRRLTRTFRLIFRWKRVEMRTMGQRHLVKCLNGSACPIPKIF